MLKSKPFRGFASPVQDEDGMATIESLPLLIVFLIFFGYGLGLFGYIHTAILHSISARTYAFETFRNRTNTTIFREYSPNPQSCHRLGMRFHSLYPENESPGVLTATARPLAKGLPVTRLPASVNDHNVKIFNLDPRNRTVSMSSPWVMVGYGLCLNPQCGD